MRSEMLKQSHKSNKLAWLVAPLILVAAVTAGSFSFFMAHAASPFSGAYSLRAVTTAGPQIGTYITGNLQLTVNGTNITGGACGLSYAPSHCTSVTGTVNGNTATLVISHLGTFPNITLTGTLTSNKIFTGLAGTFTVGSSSGRWEGIQVAGISDISGSYYVYMQGQRAPFQHLTEHGVLNIVQDAKGKLTGTFCPDKQPCLNAVGGENQKGSYVYVYVDFIIAGQTVPQVQLRGTFTNNHRMNGQFQELVNGKLTEAGYFLAH